MNFLTFGISVQGNKKDHVNQDRFGTVTVKTPSGKEVLLAAVADGVSMCFKGEIASYNTVRFVLNWGALYFSENEFDPAMLPEDIDLLVTEINQNLNHYSNSIKKKKLKEGYSPYSSTTLSLIITDGKKILYFNVGDSLIYELKNYTTECITGGKKHVNKSGRLTSYIGGIEDKNLDIRCIEKEFDFSSAYILCTDGMSNRIIFNVKTDDDFRKFNQRLLLAASKEKGSNVLRGMAEYVISKGEDDDITALVIKGIRGV